MTFKQISKLQQMIYDRITMGDLEGLKIILKDNKLVTVEQEGLKNAVCCDRAEIVDFFLKRNILLTDEKSMLYIAKGSENSQVYELCLNAVRKQKLQMLEEDNV